MSTSVKEKELTTVKKIRNTLMAKALEPGAEEETGWPFPFCVEEPTPFSSGQQIRRIRY
jgi:hypothetical protein